MKHKKGTKKPTILIVSQSHTAVDNILEGMLNLDKENVIRTIRIGDISKVSNIVSSKFTIEANRIRVNENIREKSSLYVNNRIVEGVEIEKWEKVKIIQEEWLNRFQDNETLDYQLINSATLIAGTCIGFLSNEYVKDMVFDYVIVDEAAKATTPELLVSIIKSRKIILVGDQNQLPPFADEKLSKLAKELVKDPKYRIFDILYSNLPDTHKVILSTQYRMIRNIGDLISTIFYGGKIATGVSDSDRRHGIDFIGNLSIIWYNTSNMLNSAQQKQHGGSFINISEVDAIKDFLNKLNSSRNASTLDIGIITGYSAQKNLLKKNIKTSNYEFDKLDINTLDAFQGRENDIIIYSTVRTNDSIGFQVEKERINVAFSRARRLLV